MDNYPNDSEIYTPKPEEQAATVKKNRRPLTRTAAVLLMCCCVLLSGISAFIGAGLAVNGGSSAGGDNVSGVGGAALNYSDTVITSESDITAVAEKASPSVVEITTETVSTSSFFGQYVTSGAGSGVIISPDGYILTCAHVIENASTVTVTAYDGTQYDATLVGSDADTDTAVIKIDANDLTAALIGDSDSLTLGEQVVAIGNPLGTLGGTVTNGIISALDRRVDIDSHSYNLLQTNAAINPGNSGGGLFNAAGQLIGIVNAKSSGSDIEGLGFAIPINDAVKIAEELIEYGYVTGRPRLGINVFEVTQNTDIMSLRNSDYSELIDYIDECGVYFLNYSDNQSGKLKFGDRIIAIDGSSVATLGDISAMLSGHEVGDTLTVTVMRGDGKSKVKTQVDVVLVESQK